MARADQVSLAMMLLGPLVAGGTAAMFRPPRRKLAAALAAGAFVACANSIVEIAAATLGLFRVDGLFSLWGTPLSRTFGWTWLGFAYCLQYDAAMERFARRALARAVVIGAGVAAGLLFDYLGTGPLAFLALGPSGHPLHVLLVWLILLPATLGVYEWLRGTDG